MAPGCSPLRSSWGQLIKTTPTQWQADCRLGSERRSQCGRPARAAGRRPTARRRAGQRRAHAPRSPTTLPEGPLRILPCRGGPDVGRHAGWSPLFPVSRGLVPVDLARIWHGTWSARRSLPYGTRVQPRPAKRQGRLDASSSRPEPAYVGGGWACGARLCSARPGRRAEAEGDRRAEPGGRACRHHERVSCLLAGRCSWSWSSSCC
jgi:hypothetical protein